MRPWSNLSYPPKHDCLFSLAGWHLRATPQPRRRIQCHGCSRIDFMNWRTVSRLPNKSIEGGNTLPTNNKRELLIWVNATGDKYRRRNSNGMLRRNRIHFRVNGTFQKHVAGGGRREWEYSSSPLCSKNTPMGFRWGNRDEWIQSPLPILCTNYNNFKRD